MKIFIADCIRIYIFAAFRTINKMLDAMKKIFSFVIVLAAVAMVSCGGNTTKKAAETEAAATEAVAAPASEAAACAEKCDSTACANCEKCDSTKTCCAEKTAEAEAAK